MATRISWKTIYAELPAHVATALRTARLRPEQLQAKTDGEILSIEGINDTALTAIRAVYPALAKDEADAKVIEMSEAKAEEAKEKEVTPTKKESVKIKIHSKRYQAFKKRFSQKPSHTISEAIDILHSHSRSGRPNTLEIHINTVEIGIRGEAKLPFSTGKQAKIEVFSVATATKIEDNKIDFDILLARPADMPKLAKYAKVLGPKGLMPNPKNGTITEDPEKRATTLSEGSLLSYKTELKFPIIHTTLGKADQDKEQLTANLKALINSIGVKKIVSAFAKTTHSPSLRLSLDQQ